MNCDLDSSIPDWVIEYPESTKVFNRLGIETCCGGKSLEFLCIERDLSSQAVLLELETIIRSKDSGLSSEEKFD